MAFKDLMGAYINSLAPRGGAGRTTITGMGRDSGAKYRAMMAGMQEQARQKQQMERRLMPSAPMQQAPTQPVQQAPPVVAPAAGAAAPTAGGGPTNWQRAFPRMQGMGIGMMQGAQVSPYNRAPNWASSLAGGFQGAEQYGQAADARALEGAQEDRTTSLRAQIAQILRSETELTVEDIQEMVALAMQAEDVGLAQNLIRLLQDSQDRASGAGTTAPKTITKEVYDPDTGKVEHVLFDELTGRRVGVLGEVEPDTPTSTSGGIKAPKPGFAPDGRPADVRENEGVTEHSFDGITWQPGGRLYEIPEVEDEGFQAPPEQRAKAETFLGMAEGGGHFDTVHDYDGDFSFWDAVQSNVARMGSGATSLFGVLPLVASGIQEPDDRTMVRSAEVLAEAWLRLTTGAAYTGLEKTDALKLFLRRPAKQWTATDEEKLRANVRALQKVLNMIARGEDPTQVVQSELAGFGAGTPWNAASYQYGNLAASEGQVPFSSFEPSPVLEDMNEEEQALLRQALGGGR